MPTEEQFVPVVANMMDHRQERRGTTELKTLVATPHDFGNLAADATTVTNLSMPTNARLALSHSVAVSLGDITVNIGGRKNFGHPDLDADIVQRGQVAEEGMVISITRGAAAIAGTFTLYFVDPYGVAVAIGTATFT
jgi:hypothetical protein